ncbi:uncharacterized protein HMPREF1541_04252 [Cyphellophora europaea CBS 101466]|uniref:Piwi domain-containing protein n=1 Tax=Cyphellophora europaea (strain CBS 101466) TaxID=1220924 RepID=W2RU73_CYPE1|nr:uncharacterized protein HMPREF1541_04252 [Cyphellophora europaea CBS 101466]ETN39977.1 hypothetical protein HMPREF1541_04252 [Cyphellophora europaea CBS 101466]
MVNILTVPRPQPSYPALIDPVVEQKEDAIASGLKGLQPTEAQFPYRPGFGTRGKQIQLWTNYFELIHHGDLVLHRYAIAILPDRNGKTPAGRKLKRIIKILLEEHLGQYRPGIVTDYKSTILSKDALEVTGSYDVSYRGEEEEDPSPNQIIYQVTLHQNAVLSISELLDYVNSTDSTRLVGSKEELIQALNIVIGHCPKEEPSIVNIGANKHYGMLPPSDRFDLGAGLRAIRGFFTSVRLATARVLVNAQVKHAAFYTAGPLDGLMQSFIRENGQNKVKLLKFVTRLLVNVTHIVRRSSSGRAIPRIKVIAGLAKPADGAQQHKPPVVPEFGAGPKNVQFFLAGGQKQPPKPKGGTSKGAVRGGAALGPGRYISVFDFFQQTYNITIRDTSLPVLNVGTSDNPVYLPAQVCVVRGGQHTVQQLSPSQTQNMIRFAVRSPERNATSVTVTGRQFLGFDSTSSTLSTLGLRVDHKLLSVAGRVLDSPSVLYHGLREAGTQFGSWNLQKARFATAKALPYWTYLAISFAGRDLPWGTESNLQNQISELTKKLNEVGITAARCIQGMTLSVNAANAESQIDAAIHRFMNSPNRPPPNFLLAIMPARDAMIYNRVKYACDVKEGLLNICVVASKFMKPNNDQYFANVSLKANLKLGGTNHTLDSSKLGIVAKGKTMVVGLDVTHPSPGSTKSAPSVAGIVASVDKRLGQWPGELHILPARQEMVSGLKDMVKARLKYWQLKHKVLPDNILVYRDGVSEGQYQAVLDNELPSFRAACKELYTAQQTNKGIPRITIVIVGKRHSTRFYPTEAKDADRSSNPPNGTVVDRGITEARNWDFFLQAHTAIQGTARPAHYFVILDEIFRAHPVQAPYAHSGDALEDLTHNLCYLFGRATKAVSICPPAYYADLLCERARCYLSRVFDPEAAETGSTISQSTPATDMGNAIRIHANVRDSMFYV